ncbi:MAG: M20/M25/M40 family metallo-hydrolase, partial [Chloroflexi bacterium]|nr:M20/M25/M40 family metallo-hydrolase [Chloroflexota bacterium]
MEDASSGSLARAALFQALDRRWDAHLDTLRALVRARSTQGEEAAAQRLVALRLREAGIEPDVFDVDPAGLAHLPGWVDGPLDFAGRPNVVGTLRGTGGGRSLILAAHVDSVAPGPPELWRGDPWSGEVDGGRLLGRGSWDDKAGVAAILWIAGAIGDAGLRLRGDLILQSVIEEESSGVGTLACSARGYRADAAVVVDGRGPGGAVVAHCGQLWFRVTVRGRTAAAVESRRGRNAIDHLATQLRGLREMERAFDRRPEPPFDAVEHPFQLNAGVIAGGATPTTVPGLASLDCHLVFPPPLTLEGARSLVRRRVAETAALEGWAGDLHASV